MKAKKVLDFKLTWNFQFISHFCGILMLIANINGVITLCQAPDFLAQIFLNLEDSSVVSLAQ